MHVKSYPLSVVLHLLAIIIYGYSLCWLFFHELSPKDRKSIGGRLKFLTYWDLWIQLTTFIIALICDFISNPNNNRNQSKPPLIVSIRDVLFNAWTFPVGAFVTTTFWTIYSVDRQLIYPASEEKWYPIWLNHTTHTLVFPIVLIENYLVYHNRRAHKTQLALILTLSITYALWVLYIGLATGHWVYPVLEVLSWPLRVAFMLSANAAIIVLYYLGALCSSIAWKSSVRHRIESRRKIR